MFEEMDIGEDVEKHAFVHPFRQCDHFGAGVDVSFCEKRRKKQLNEQKPQNI